MTVLTSNWVRRGQFLLGPAAFARMEGWDSHLVGDGLVVAAHPDLPVCRVEHGKASLVLLGHLIDPRAPEDGNADILERLANGLRDAQGLEDFPRLTDGLCGRWILMAKRGSSAILFHDAAGQRQVHYAFKEGLPYCASQASLIARHLGFDPNPEASDFVEAAKAQMGEHFGYQFWWPHDRTVFRDIKRLLPNHCLDLCSGEVRRYFGTEALHPISLDDAVTSACALLQGAFVSARNRFPLALGCTAGWDSRVLMAASLPVYRDVFYYTNRRYGWNRRHPDAAVPTTLLRRKGIRHHGVDMPRHMSEAFAQAYRANVDGPHEIWGVTAEGELRGLPADAVVVTGHVSEVSRCFFWKEGTAPEASPETLARCVAEKTGLPECRFTLDAFGHWLAEDRFGNGLHVLDMFYWEQRAGSWAATRNDELAIAHETIPLFNCRELLLTLLSVDVRFRRGPDYELYRRIIGHLWPEALSEAINPPKPPASLTERGADALAWVARRVLSKSVRERLESAARGGRRAG